MEDILYKIRNKFSKLTFNEELHKYSIEGKELKGSVSSLIKDFCIPFDKYTISNNISKRTGESQKDILNNWSKINLESLNRGNRVHLFGEKYQFNRSLKPSCPQEEAIVKFWSSLPRHIVPIAAEVRMYHTSKMFPGTLDVLLYNNISKKCIIIDYKTNKDLFKNFKEKKLIGKFSHLLDTPFNHYQIQLSLYQILLEQIEISVERRIIIHLGMDGNYKMYDTEDYTNILNGFLEEKYPQEVVI